MDQRRNLFPYEDPIEKNFQVEIMSPPGLARNGGHAEGNNDATNAQTTQAALN